MHAKGIKICKTCSFFHDADLMKCGNIDLGEKDVFFIKHMIDDSTFFEKVSLLVSLFFTFVNLLLIVFRGILLKL